MPYRYLQRVQARRNQGTGSSVQSGMQVGQEVGKLLGGLAGAIKGAQKDALANKLMDEQSIGDQPHAGVTQDLGPLGGDGSGGDSSLNDAVAQSQATQGLGQLPPDTSTFTNPATGNVEPLQGQPSQDDQLQQAIAAAQVQGGSPAVGDAPVSQPTAGGPQPAVGGSQPTAGGSQPTAAQPASGDFTLNPSDFSAGGTAFGDKGTQAGTVGGLIHTGGTQEMELRKEMLTQQLQKSKAAAETADQQDEAAGTGKYALNDALKRAQLAEANQRLAAGGTAGGAKKTKADAVPPAENVGSEPVTSQAQLNNHIDDRWGKGSANDFASTVNAPAQIPNPKATLDSNGNSTDPAIPATIPNPDAVTINNQDGTVTVGPKGHRVTMQMQEAQTLVKQQNALLKRQGMPLLRVPGEAEDPKLGPMIGADAAHPYPAKTNLDIYSRASGTWVQLPDGRVKQVP